MQQVCNISNGPNYQNVLIGLFIFGIAYNFVVWFLEIKGWERGVTSLLVVVGCGVTIAPLAWLANSELFTSVVGLFAASGGPMVAGSIYRYVRERQDESAEIIKAARAASDDKQT